MAPRFLRPETQEKAPHVRNSRKAWDRLIKILVEVPAVIALLVMMLHVTFNAISRSMFNQPISGTLELTQYWYMPIVVLLAFVAAQHRDQHVSADIVFGLLPEGIKGYVHGIAMSTAALVSAGFTWFTTQEAISQTAIRATAGAMGTPSWPVQIIVPVVFGLLTIQFLAAAVRAFGAKSTNHIGDAQTANFETENVK